MDPLIKSDFEALTKDATLWDAAGDTLEAAHDQLAGITVNRGAFSFAAIDLADQYAELHSQVMALLKSGAAETRAGAAALRAVRDDFERFEDVTKSDLYKMWQPAE
jgi:hypothetical protein